MLLRRHIQFYEEIFKIPGFASGHRRIPSNSQCRGNRLRPLHYKNWNP